MIIQEKIKVTGRGIVFIVDLKENGYTDQNYIKEIPIKIGDNILHEHKTYIVVGIESQSYGYGYNSIIGLNVKKIK